MCNEFGTNYQILNEIHVFHYHYILNFLRLFINCKSIYLHNIVLCRDKCWKKWLNTLLFFVYEFLWLFILLFQLCQGLILVHLQSLIDQYLLHRPYTTFYFLMQISYFIFTGLFKWCFFIILNFEQILVWCIIELRKLQAIGRTRLMLLYLINQMALGNIWMIKECIFHNLCCGHGTHSTVMLRFLKLSVITKS